MPNVIIATNSLLAVGTGTSSADRDLSNRLRKMTLNETFDDHDVTTMGSTTRVRAIGLGEAEFTAELMQSFSTADAGENIDNILNELIGVSQGGGKFLVRMRPVNGNRGPSNPEYSMLCVMAERTPFDGEVGDPLVNPITFLSAGNLTRSIATT